MAVPGVLENEARVVRRRHRSAVHQDDGVGLGGERGLAPLVDLRRALLEPERGIGADAAAGRQP